MNRVIATWGVLCVLALLGQAIARLTPMAIEPWLDGSLTITHQVLYVVAIVFMGYSEGYRGFQLRFSPRVVARAFWLGDNPTPLRVIFALPFCMSLFHSTKRQMTISYSIIVMIVLLVWGVRHLSQPWRGMVDAGVVVGLAWGSLAILAFYFQALRGNPPPMTDLPS